MAKKSSAVGKAIKKTAGKKVSVQRLAVPQGDAVNYQSIEHVRQLAWAGQHAAAINSATKALDRSRLKRDVERSLLDLRAESYIAIGKLDLAMKDAKAMGKIAKGDTRSSNTRISKPDSRLLVQSLNRLALVQMRTGDLKAAVKSATSAVKASANQKSKIVNRQLHAESLFRLAEAQLRTRKSEAAVETAQKTIALYQELGDFSGMGRAYWLLANAFFNMNRAEESRRAAQTALELCRQAGDQYGIGNALIALSNTDVDLAERIQHLQGALQAFETAGYAERQAAALGNLSLAYLELGLYPHTRRLGNKVLEMVRTMGAKMGLTYALGNLIGPELILGNLASARLHMQEFEKLVPDLGDPIMDADLLSIRAELAFATGDHKAAIRHQKSALKINKEAQTGSEHTYLTELAKMHLAVGDPAAALKATTQATALHRAQDFAKPDGFTSQAIWWRHVQALNANKKTKETRQALERAYDFLLEQIGGIRDAGLRRNALNKVEVNRELLQFWVKDGAKRKLPKERLFAHLAIEMRE